MDETRLPNLLRILMPRMVEAVHSHLHRSIAFHVMDLQRPWNQFPRHFAADILLYAVRQILPSERDAALIVVELHILDEKAAELIQITPVISIKKRRIQRRDGLIQFLLRFN